MDPLLPTLALCLLVLGALVASAILRANGGQHAWRPGCALTVEALKQRLATEGGRHRLVASVEDSGELFTHHKPVLKPILKLAA